MLTATINLTGRFCNIKAHKPRGQMAQISLQTAQNELNKLDIERMNAAPASESL